MHTYKKYFLEWSFRFQRKQKDGPELYPKFLSNFRLLYQKIWRNKKKIWHKFQKKIAIDHSFPNYWPLTFKYFTLQVYEFAWNSIFARTPDSYLTCLHRDPWAIEEPFQPFLLGWCIRGNSASPECIEPWSRAWRALRHKRAPVGANQIWHP